MPSSASSSSSSSSSLYIISAFSPPRTDPMRALDAALEGADTDEDSGGALSRTVAERYASSFQAQGPLDALCRKYGVPEHYSAIVPAGNQRACSPPPPGSICVYAHALEAGMRVLLHPFFCQVLAHFGVAPSQIAPNGWRAMAGFVVLSHSAGVPPSLPVFHHFFSLRAFKLKGWYCFRGKDAADALFKGMPLSFRGRNWKEAFFFLRSSTPWPCPVRWGQLSKTSTAEPVLTREERRVVKKLLRFHGAAVDINAYLSERNLAAAMISGSAKPPPPPPIRTATSAGAIGMDPSVYDMMKNLRAAKAAQAQASGVQVTVKSEPASDTHTLSSRKKRKLEEDAATASPLVVSTLKSSKGARFDHDHGTKSRQRMPGLPDGDTADWGAARQMLRSIVTPAMEQTFSAAKPSDVIASSYITALQAANYASFSLGYALELEEKLAAREREADALRQELAQAKAELVGAEEARNARKAAVREFPGSTEQVLRFAEHALAGYEKGMEDMKRAVLRRYPHLDPEQLVVPVDGGGAQ